LADPAPQAVTAEDLIPGPGIARTPSGEWYVSARHVRLTAVHSLPSGWYEVDVGASSAEASGRKRLELTFDSPNTSIRPPSREAFAWTDRFRERFVVRLDGPAARVRLDLWEAQGAVELPGFSVRPLPRLRLLARSLVAKVRLLRAHRCTLPALGRAARLVLRGEFRQLLTKLRGGLLDARTMLPEMLTPGASSPHLQRSPLQPDLLLAADIRGVSGYDRVGLSWASQLSRLGLAVAIDPKAIVRWDAVPPGLRWPIAKRRGTTLRLIVGPPFRMAAFAPDARSMVYTMWETDTLAPEWVQSLNRAARVLVPSAWQVEGFRRSGVTVPIEVVPLGHDPRLFHPSATRQARECTFGTAAAVVAGGVRKNVQAVVDGFREAFPRETDVRLRVKLSLGSPIVETFDDPRIEVLRAVLSPEELADWYRSLTAYVNLSSGEGFGLHLLEAVACGCPLVTPNHGGLTTFFEPASGYAVDFRLEPVRGSEIYSGHWATPEEASCVARLREVYENQADAAGNGLRAALVAAAFTWDAAGERLAAELKRFPG